jgi:hypothetical protein
MEICAGAGALFDERTEVAERFAGLAWTDVPDAILGFNADALYFMTEAAFAYYLPAFMRKSLKDHEGADMIPVQVLTMLTPGSNDERLTQFVEGLNPSQKEVVRRFLEHLGNYPDDAAQAERALQFWRGL